MDVPALAEELRQAYERGTPVTPPSARGNAFDLAAAYDVEAALARARVASGRRTVGRKVGFANKAMWRILKLETLVWAHMYDDTVRFAGGNAATLSLDGRHSPRLEPEIVFKLARAMPEGTADAAAALAHVEWLALGFEINDCLYPDWKFQPADFVAAYGLHTALIVGEPQPVTADGIAALAGQLPAFTLQLSKNGALVEEGAGRNSLRSPALALGELARAAATSEPLQAGEIVSTGTLTAAQPIAPGETWTAHVDGLNLPDLTVTL